MKKLSTLLLTLLLSTAFGLRGAAQVTGQVLGQLLDEKNRPLPFATVLLRQVVDTTWVRAEVARADGHYDFSNLAPASYRVTVIMLGYQSYRSAPFELKAIPGTVQVSPIQLELASHQLKGVNVVGQKPLLEMRTGKMVLNVADSPAAAGATAIEVLQKIPGLVVMNDRISLAGREGLTILLDGRTTQYTDVLSVLKDFPSSNIDRIEVVTQPGAAYDAAGSAGIINIILKKNTSLGSNGTIGLTAGYGRFGRAGTTLDLNYRTAKGLNVFGGYGYTYRKTYEQLNTDRVVTNGSQVLTYVQRSYQPRTTGVNTMRVGADLALSRRQTLGVLFTGYTARTEVDAENSINVNDSQQLLQNMTRTNSQRRTDSYAGNLNYKIALDSTGRELVLDADFSSYHSGNDNRLINALEGSPMQLLRFDQQTAIQLRSAKADYSHPIGKAKVTTGVKVSAADIDSQLDFTSLAQSTWLPEPGRSDHFRYQEQISAGYLSLDKQWGSLQVQAGLRAEQTHSAASSMALSRTVTRDYFQLFPSISLDQALTKKLGVSLSYGRRIDRPNYQDLNPSIVYLDPYTQQKGNPFLKPQFTHAYSAAVTYQKQPVLLLAYNRTNDAISLVTAQQDSVLYSTSSNLGRLDNYSATLNFPLNLGKLVSGYGGTNVFYNHYQGQYLNGEYSNGKLSAIVYLQSKVRLPMGVGLELSGFYHTAGLNGLINFRPFGSATVGLQKTIWKDQLQVRLVASDVLFTNKQRGTVQYQDMNIRFFTQNESRQVRLSLSYKFGNQRLLAARKRVTGLDEERGRVKSDKE